MGQNVVTGAMLSCSFGAAPSTLNALPTPRVMIEGKPAATIQDFAPIVNIPPFGMCSSPSNPMVIGATAAAMGVFTPMPCIPVTQPWVPIAPTKLIGGQPALVTGSVCMCAWAGVVQISFAGSVQTQTS